MRTLFSIVALLLMISLCASASTTVQGNINNLANVPQGSGAYVQFELKNCGTNNPQVTGVTTIINKPIKLVPNASGFYQANNFWGNNEITCGGVTGNTWYEVTVFAPNGSPTGPALPYCVCSSPWTLESATPLFQKGVAMSPVLNPVYTNPTGSQTITEVINTSFTVQAAAANGSGTFNIRNFSKLTVGVQQVAPVHSEFAGRVQISENLPATTGLTLQSNVSSGTSFSRAWIGHDLYFDPADGLWHNPSTGLGANDFAGILLSNATGIKFITNTNTGSNLPRTFNQTALNALTRLHIDENGLIGFGQLASTAPASIDQTGKGTFADLVAKSGPYADIRAYGAKGDCTTDDTAAIQSALDANANKRPVVIPALPAGSNCWRINSSLLLNQGNTLMGTGLNGTITGSELWYFGADATHAIKQKANSSTTDTSKVAVIRVRLIDKRTSPTSGDGIHCERCVNGNFINENFVSGFPGNDIYVGGPSGTASDVTQIMDNWVTAFGQKGIKVERLNNNVVVSGTRCDAVAPVTGDACVYVTNTSISAPDATVSIRDTKGEINNGAHLIWLDTNYGAVSVDSALMRGPSSYNGLGGDTLRITGTEGQSVTAININGTPVCTNVINVVAKGKTIPCTSTGPRVRAWVGGADGYQINTGAGFFGVFSASDSVDETMYGKGKLLLGPCDGVSTPVGTCLGGSQELFTVKARSIGEIPLKVYRFTGQTSRLLQISTETNTTLFGVNSDGSAVFTGSVVPTSAGGGSIGSSTAPVSGVQIGTDNTNRVNQTASGITAARAVVWRNVGDNDTPTHNIVKGTSAMGTSAISAGTCATVVTTAATGVLTTDTIEFTFNAAPGTGWPSLTIHKYPTAGNVNFLVCNPTAGSVTPAAATLNWKVVR